MKQNTDIAYAAGYIDGDGCFHIAKHKSKFISQIIITSTNKTVLVWFKKNFGGVVSSPKSNIPTNHKPLYQLSMNKKDGLRFTQIIKPYLVEKIDEARIFINFVISNSSVRNIHRQCLIEQINSIKNSTNLVSASHKEEFETARNTISPTIEDFAYLAGFIDAECCLGIQKYRSKNKPNYLYKIQLQCNNTKAPVFKWLLERFGGQIHFIDRSIKFINHRDQLAWRLTSASLSNILSKIHPFLKYKKPVCEELIKFTNITLPNGGARHTEKFRDAYAKILEERECIVNQIHILNQKGTN